MIRPKGRPKGAKDTHPRKKRAAVFKDISEILNQPAPEFPPSLPGGGEPFEITVNYIPNSPKRGTK